MCFDSKSPGGFSIAFLRRLKIEIKKRQKRRGFHFNWLGRLHGLTLDLAFMIYRLMTFSSLEGEQNFTFDQFCRNICSIAIFILCIEDMNTMFHKA